MWVVIRDRVGDYYLGSLDNDPSCDREVPPPPAALPDAGSNGCFSMPDGSRFRVVHVTRESPPSGACPAGTTETRILGPLVPTQWLQSEGAICADPQMLGRCPFPAAMDSIDSITLQPDGIMQLDFDINDVWFFNVDVKKIDINTDVTINGAIQADVDIDPWVFGIGFGRRF